MIAPTSTTEKFYAVLTSFVWVFDYWNFMTFFFLKGSDDEDESQKVPPPPETPMPPPLPPTPDQVIVRKDYDPKGKSGC